MGFRSSVLTTSWKNDLSVPKSHRVITTFRSMPCGRGGAGGTWPAAIRLLQSANIANPRSCPKLLRLLVICGPTCPDMSRRSHANEGESNVPRLASISRVALLPI